MASVRAGVSKRHSENPWRGAGPMVTVLLERERRGATLTLPVATVNGDALWSSGVARGPVRGWHVYL
jgi:hypothetical protein